MGLILDPVLPMYCAQTGASLPLAWELAWSRPVSDRPVRLVPPAPAPPLDTSAWPRTLAGDAEVVLPPAVRMTRTPQPFLERGDPVTVLFGVEPPAFVELPVAVGAALASETTVSAVRDRWGQPQRWVDHRLVGMARLGLLHLASLPEPAPEGRERPRRALVQEAWTRSLERRSGEHVLANSATGTFLKTGPAARALWERAGEEDGVDEAALPERIRPVARTLLTGGLLRAVRTP